MENYGKNPIKKVLRTPTERFKNLPGYNFQENYLTLDEQLNEGVKLRMHYIDEGNKNSQETILLMHGEPTWSYLYRKFVPILVQQGYRVVVPDLIGFGKSDKPSERSDYSYERKVNWVRQFIEQLNLSNITLFCQDWGGLISLRVVPLISQRFSRIIIANTTLPTGITDQASSQALLDWINETSQKMESWSILMDLTTIPDISEQECDAYEAPFPSEEYKVATRVAPKLVPIVEGTSEALKNKEALQFYTTWKKPFLTLFADGDPIFSGQGIDEMWQNTVPGAKGQKHSEIEDSGHFLQEDQPEKICEHIIKFIQQNGGQQQQQLLPKL